MCLGRQPQSIALLNPFRAFDALAVQADLARAKPFLLGAKANMRREALDQAVKPLNGLLGGAGGVPWRCARAAAARVQSLAGGGRAAGAGVLQLLECWCNWGAAGGGVLLVLECRCCWSAAVATAFGFFGRLVSYTPAIDKLPCSPSNPSISLQ